MNFRSHQSHPPIRNRDRTQMLPNQVFKDNTENYQQIYGEDGGVIYLDAVFVRRPAHDDASDANTQGGA